VQRTEKLLEITSALSGASTRQDVLTIIVEKAMPALGAVGGGILELSPSGEHLVLSRGTGLPKPVLEAYAVLTEDSPWPTSDVLRTHEPVFMRTTADWLSRYPPPPLAAPLDERSRAVLPLLIGDRLIGMITLTFGGTHVFDQAERMFMMAVAAYCAQALDRARLFEAEQRARAKAEAASNAKSDFLAVMSHELRTPLTAVIGYADLLDGEVPGPLNEAQKQHIKRMKASAWHLLDLISDILSFSKIEAGREEPNLHVFVVHDLAREVISVVMPQAEHKGLSVQLVLPPDQLTMHSDAAKVRQILLNLLSNAVKFTEAGSVRLTVLSARCDILFIVEDSGPGIAPADRERVFEAFTQLDQSATRSIGGVGLGLSVSRKLARLLGGDIEVDNAPGGGAAFVLRLPASAVPASNAGQKRASTPR